MDRELRERFNRGWTPELARGVQTDLTRRLAGPIPFPVAETPIFFDEAIRNRFETAAREVVAELSDPAWIAAHEDAVPEAYRAPNRGHLPHFAQIDFAVVRDDAGNLVPRLVELQGFPSLYGFQILLADVWAAHLAAMPDMPDRWRLFFGGQDRYTAMALLRETLVGDHDADEAILLDIEPEYQKTLPDFKVTQRWWGVDPVCLTELKRDGNRLFRVKDGRTIPVKRIFQRVVFDEMEQRQVRRVFDFNEPLEVEWAGHPAWWFLWSKRSMLYLDHPTVAKTTRLTELDAVPDDLSGYVLKPLYSFAGAGVNVDPTLADVDAVPEAERNDWVLQEKFEYAPAFESVQGDGVKVEVRMMFARPDAHSDMTLLLNLVRLSRGKMMGVDYNQDLDWTGASVALWPHQSTLT